MSGRSSYKPKYNKNAAKYFEDGLSPKLRAAAEALATRLYDEYTYRKRCMYDLLKRYPQDEGLQQHWTPERIEEYASGSGDTEAINRLRSKPIGAITFHDMQCAIEQDARQAIVVFTAMDEAVKDRIEAGLLASDTLCHTMPFERLEFANIRQGFIDEWQPRGGVELSLVDMLAQTYVAWQFWLQRSFDVARNQDLAEQQLTKTKTYQEPGSWRPPSVTAREWLDHSTGMADRFNRMFLRVLRQMRDLRRYSAPVTINNPKQVNIASDGGRQKNVQTTRAKKKKAKASPRQPLRVVGESKRR